MTRSLVAAALLTALAPAQSRAQMYQRPGRSPAPPTDVPPLALQNVRIEELLGSQVPPEADLVDSGGRPFRLGSLFDGRRPVLVALVYYDCPMLCGLILSGMARAMRESRLDLGKDYQAVAISFDPEEKPPLAAERRRGYLQSMGLSASGPEWPFLVGPGPTTRRIADSVGFHYEKDPVSGEWAHMAAIFVLTPAGKVSRYLYGIEYRPQDLRLSLMEAADGKVGTTLDRILLTCYRYDPAGRKYEPYALGFLRLGGALVLVALTALIAGLVLRERLRKGRRR